METSRVIIQVIRGEAPWQSLNGAGIDVRREEDHWQFPASAIGLVQPTVDDVATGLVNLWFKSDELLEWASFLLAASPLISLERLEESHEGEELLEALWDVSSGESIDIELLQRLTG